MKLIKIGTIILLGSTAFAAACSGDGGEGTGGTGGTIGSGSGTGSGAGTSTGAGSGTGGSGAGGSVGTGGGGNTTCTAVVAGDLADPVKFFSGDSADSGTSTPGTGSIQHAGPEVADPDAQGAGEYPWVSLSYAFGAAEGDCGNISALSTITLDVTSVNAGSIRIGLSIPATPPAAEGGNCTGNDCSNHFSVTEAFTPGQTKTITLQADGSNLDHAWAGGVATFTPNNVLQIVVSALPDSAASPASDSIPAYDITIGNISAQ